MTRPIAATIAAIAVVVVGAAIGGYVYFFSGLRTTPKPLALESPSPVVSSSPTASGDLTGSWTVGSGSQVGYRATEQFVGQSSTHEAVARTSAVTGGLKVQQAASGLEATDLNFAAQVGQLQSIDQVAGYNVSQRDRIVNGTLSVQRYPEASFKAQSVALPAGLTEGQQVTVNVPGQLTIHGETRDVTIAVQVQVSGSQAQVAGSIPVAMTDYGVNPPQVPITKVDPNIKIEFQLVLTKA
jgi:polyisoprenoid-binding protein YceI